MTPSLPLNSYKQVVANFEGRRDRRSKATITRVYENGNLDLWYHTQSIQHQHNAIHVQMITRDGDGDFYKFRPGLLVQRMNSSPSIIENMLELNRKLISERGAHDLAGYDTLLSPSWAGVRNCLFKRPLYFKNVAKHVCVHRGDSPLMSELARMVCNMRDAEHRRQRASNSGDPERAEEVDIHVRMAILRALTGLSHPLMPARCNIPGCGALSMCTSELHKSSHASVFDRWRVVLVTSFNLALMKVGSCGIILVVLRNHSL